MAFAQAQPSEPTPRLALSEWAAGRGEARVEFIDGRTRLTHARATAPLKLLTPDPPGTAPAAIWLYATTFGGGLVAGDAIDIHLGLGPGAAAVLTTQASTKVYHHQAGLGTSQRLTARVGPDALLVLAPDPLVCYENAIYHQHQRLHVERGGSVVLLDWFTAGRVAFGERWVFSRYASRNEIIVAERTIANDAMLLDPEDGPLADIARMGRYDCMATIMLMGDRLGPECDALVGHVQQMPIDADGELIVAASRTPWGAMFRAAGRTTSVVAEEVKRRLSFLRGLLGATPWDRKW